MPLPAVTSTYAVLMGASPGVAGAASAGSTLGGTALQSLLPDRTDFHAERAALLRRVFRVCSNPPIVHSRTSPTGPRPATPPISPACPAIDTHSTPVPLSRPVNWTRRHFVPTRTFTFRIRSFDSTSRGDAATRIGTCPRTSSVRPCLSYSRTSPVSINMSHASREPRWVKNHLTPLSVREGLDSRT